MRKGPEKLSNNAPENWDNSSEYLKAKKEAVDRAKKLQSELASNLEKTDTRGRINTNDIAWLGGPDNNKKREKNTDRTETPFGLPLPEYDHIGQWIYPTLENAWFTGANTIPALALWFVAPVAVSAKVLSNTPRDLVALLVHPIDEYRNTMDVWKNWMDQNSNTVA